MITTNSALTDINNGFKLIEDAVKYLIQQNSHLSAVVENVSGALNRTVEQPALAPAPASAKAAITAPKLATKGKPRSESVYKDDLLINALTAKPANIRAITKRIKHDPMPSANTVRSRLQTLALAGLVKADGHNFARAVK